MSAQLLVVDASVVVEVLRRSHRGDAVAARRREATLAAPAHLDAEVLSALGRLVRTGDAEPATVTQALDHLVPLGLSGFRSRHCPAGLWVAGQHRLACGLYIA